MAELTPSQRSVIGYLLQNPAEMSRFGMKYQPTDQQALRDAANNLDFGKINAIGRFFGYAPSPNIRVSEDFGALQGMPR